jgi:hypothetical protein
LGVSFYGRRGSKNGAVTTVAEQSKRHAGHLHKVPQQSAAELNPRSELIGQLGEPQAVRGWTLIKYLDAAG